MKRKFLSLFLALVLLASAAVPVCAVGSCGCGRPVYALTGDRPLYALLQTYLRFRIGTVPVTQTPSAIPAPAAEPEPVDEPTPAAEPEPVAEPSPAAEPEPAPLPQSVASDYEQEVVTLVNARRVEAGLPPLTPDDSLCTYARVKSQDLHDGGYFAHESPTYGSPFDMMRSFGISYRYAGENIAMGYTTPEAVVEAWMASEGHRANILSANYTRLGVGYVPDGGYWTQWFIG